MGTNYSLNKDPDFLEKRFGAEFEQDFEKVYHVSTFDNPSMPVITNEERDKFLFLNWGLVPFWVRDEEQAKDIRMKTVNARSDTIFEKPSFRVPIRKRRCLVVMDGYFEWREVNGRTYPYYIKMKDSDAFAVAGIWDEWINKKNEEKLRTYSVISIDANPFIEKVNNKKKRMPVILPKKDERKWIQSNIEKECIKSMLKTYDGKDLEAYPVRRLITKRGVDSNVREVLEKYDYDGLRSLDEEDNNQRDLKQTTLF
jgi:putative SOS response-associated peptidase YedK